MVVSSDGRILAQGAAGLRRSGAAARVSIKDPWHLGSCTKAMTATLAAVLVEKRKLSWDLTIAKALPGLDVHEDLADVTLEDLLCMRGGIGHAVTVPGLWDQLWKREGSPLRERRKLAKALLERETKQVQRGEFLYSNSSLAIAGHMMETVMKRPYEQLMKRYVFAPLRMRSAGFAGVPWKVGVGPSPHDKDGRPLDHGEGADNPPAIAPAGTAHATLSDWAAFVAEHLRGAQGKRGKLLREPSFKRLHAGHGKNGYALGWGTLTAPWARGTGDGATGRLLTHAGSNNSWLTLVWIAPERDFAVLFATNIGGEGVRPRADAACQKVIDDHIRSIR